MPASRDLWQPGDLLADGDRWMVAADRILGDAWGLLAPVRPATEGGWEVAAPPGTRFPLTRVTVDELQPLEFPQGGVNVHGYLCLLRYDLPDDRPGASFAIGADPGLLSKQPLAAGWTGGGADGAGPAEIDVVLRALWRQYGPALANRLVDRPPAAALHLARQARAPGEPLLFVFASCQYPAGMMDRQDANRSQAALAAYLAARERPPERVLLVGDQVYTDATYGLLDPIRMDDRYRLPYEHLLAPDGPLAELPQSLRLRMRMTPDDHEIVDNWEPWGPGITGERHKRGMAAYWRYQRARNAPLPQVWITEAEPAAGWHLFMADSRSTREFRNEDRLAQATLLGQAQTLALEDWLRAAPAGDLKIVTTAAMLLPRVRIDRDEPLALDNWQGYPASFQRMLAFLCDHRLENLVFLAGDAHLGCSADVRVRNLRTGAETRFGSHHAPALYAPYPFANETQWNLSLRDRFRFAWTASDGQPADYECTVEASVLGDQRTGCGLLEARRDGGGWKLAVSFLADQEMRTPFSAAM